MSESKKFDAEKLADLLARVTDFTEADAMLDSDIEWGLGDWENLGGWWRRHKITGEEERYNYRGAPSYTTSIDAALSLVAKLLPGWVCETLGEDAAGRIGEMQGMGWTAEFSNGLTTAQGQARTLPLAILAALLSALSSNPSDTE